MPDEEISGYTVDIDSEDESDASPLPAQALRPAFVTGSDWTTETLLSQLRRGNIDLNPRFQRREVWRPDRRSRFIESILLNLPIPQIVLAEQPDDPNRFLVLDGKQRLLAIRQFCSDPDRYPDDKPFTPLRLEQLTIRQDLNGETYVDLQSKPGHADDLNAFENHTIRTVVIRNWPNDDFLYLVFLRLNTGSVQLSPQELRQALRPGPFVDFVDDHAINSEWLHRALGIKEPDFRMRDTEVLVRFFGFTNFLEDYRGNLKQFLDATCERLNQRWGEEEDRLRDQAESCDRAIATTLAVFGEEHAFTRFREGRFEGRFNRAVFDVMTYYFRQSSFSELAEQRSQAISAAFIDLCREDASFNEAIGTTTKSLQATAYRFVAWGDALSSAVGADVGIPEVFRRHLAGRRP